MSSTKSPVIMDATEMIKGLKPEDLKNLLKAKMSEQMPEHSPAMQARINALKHVQVDLLKCEANFYDELHELEIKYTSIYEPFFEQRRRLVMGEVEPTESEAKWELDEEPEIENVDKKILAIQNENGDEVVCVICI